MKKFLIKITILFMIIAICDFLFGKGMDVYHVLSETCDSIDRAPTIALFKPSQNVSKQRETKLKALYQQYHNPPRK